MNWPLDSHKIARYLEVKIPGVKCYLVGGSVRDKFLPASIPKDADVEVFGCSYYQLEKALIRARDYSFPEIIFVDTVGKSFGIVKVRLDGGGEIDFSIPRRESKNAGTGHTAFDVVFDPDITPREAALRRDFTMNSMYEDTHGIVHDPYGGMIHLKKRILSATSYAFKEDPLRVLRGMQFASRFNMTMDLDTYDMCEEMQEEYDSLSKDRIWGEWKKWALGYYPSKGLTILWHSGWVTEYPELHALGNTPQDPDWHPEGDVWDHTLFVVDAAARIGAQVGLKDEDQLILVFAALLHDVGKPFVTQKIDGRWKSPNHAEVGTHIAEDFLNSIGAPKHLIENVIPLIREHMVHIGTEPTHRVVRRLSTRLEPSNIKLLRYLVLADMKGRPPLPEEDCLLPWLEIAEQLRVENEKPKRILMGRHLIELGLEPGKEMGKILNQAYEAQLDGYFDTLEDALHWAKDLLPTLEGVDE